MFMVRNGNEWKWMEMNGNEWKWMEMNGNEWKWMEMNGNEWKCGLKISQNQSKYVKISPVGSMPCSSAITSQNLAPIWFPHWPPWTCTSSRMASEGSLVTKKGTDWLRILWGLEPGVWNGEQRFASGKDRVLACSDIKKIRIMNDLWYLCRIKTIQVPMMRHLTWVCRETEQMERNSIQATSGQSRWTCCQNHRHNTAVEKPESKQGLLSSQTRARQYGFVWKCWVYSQWNSHLIGIMIINHWV